MTTRLLSLLGACLLCLTATVARATLPTELTVISYHEIADKADALDPIYAVSPTNFVRQLDWLKNHGYNFVSVSQLLAARSGKAILPEKAVLITFDDGYKDMYTNAFPILKLFNAPAVESVVGSWLEPTGGDINFDGKKIPRDKMLSWDEMHEMVNSGLVEIGSHTYGLHDGALSNPQGNMQPAATARLWLPAQKRYETENEYKKRVTADLRHNNEVLVKHGLPSPHLIAWPYGRYNIELRTIAQQLGMPVGLTLDDGPNTITTPLWGLRRILVEGNMQLWDLDKEIAMRNANLADEDRPNKIMHIDLDYIYDPDPAQQEKNLGHLLEHIVAMGVNTVYLQAFADPDANGSADAVYFPNRHMPMRADLFNRVAWQIRTRTPVRRLYAWMPMLAWQPPASDPASKDVLVTEPSGNPDHVNMGYPRLSLFSPRARQFIKDMYRDLAKSTPIEGILFHDDVTMSDYEDNSSFAQAQYKAWGLPTNIDTIRGSDDLLARWTILKVNALDNFAKDLTEIVNEEQPGLISARNLYAQVVLNPKSETWYSQSLENSLANYNFTAIEAMPYMEGASDPMAFLHDMVEKVNEHPGAINKVVFELQTVNWRTGEKIPSTELAGQIKALYGWGARHIAFYPDDSISNQPDPAVLRPVFDSKSNVPEIHN